MIGGKFVIDAHCHLGKSLLSGVEISEEGLRATMAANGIDMALVMPQPFQGLEVVAIHNEEGYQEIRQTLSEYYNLGNQEPDIQVYNVDRRGDRSLTLRYTQRNRRPLSEPTLEVLKHLHTLWGFPVKMETVGDDGKVHLTDQCPAKNEEHTRSA